MKTKDYNYYDEQLKAVNHKSEYPPKLVISHESGKTNWMSINKESAPVIIKWLQDNFTDPPALPLDAIGKHTPGPWETKVTRYNIPTQVFGAGVYVADCDVHTPYDALKSYDEQGVKHPISYDERIANACLIAAAPDLLNVCVEALKHHQGGHSEIGFKLNQIIQKAKGL